MNKLFASIAVMAGTIVVTVSSAEAFTREGNDRSMDRPIGIEGSGEESIAFNRDERGRRVSVRGLGGSTLSTSIGNAISVQAGTGSTVMINAQQINNGSISSTTVIGGSSSRWLNNVQE